MKKIIRLTESDLTRIIRRVISEDVESSKSEKTPFNILYDAKGKKIYPRYLKNLGDGTFVMWGKTGEWNVTLKVEDGKHIGGGMKKSTVTIDVETENKADYDYIKSKFNDAVSNYTYNPSKDMYKYRIATERDFEYEPNPTIGINFSNNKTESITEFFESLLDKVLGTFE